MDKKTRRRVGSINKTKSGRWEVRVQAGMTVSGKARRITRTVDTREDAEKVLAELAHELGRSDVFARGLTLEEYWDIYSATKGKRLLKSTYGRYEWSMRFWLAHLGSRDISRITRTEIQALLYDAPSNQEAKKRRLVLSAVLSQAVRDGVLDENVCLGAPFEYPNDVGAIDPSGIDYEEDPFGAIEGTRDVWDAETILRAMPRLEGTSIEPCWLAMVGAGLRREEALALRWKDLRCVEVGGRPVVQIAVHAAVTEEDGRHRTKGTRSVRIIGMLEPFGSRLWSLRGEPEDPVCTLGPNNIARRWKRMWDPKPTSKHVPKSIDLLAGRMLEEPAIPFVQLGRMRATHSTLMQEAGVPDSVNAAAHGHSTAIAYRHYMRPDLENAVARTDELLVLEGGMQVNERSSLLRTPPNSSEKVRKSVAE